MVKLRGRSCSRASRYFSPIDAFGGKYLILAGDRLAYSRAKIHGDKKLGAEVELDEIDAKILKALLRDARTSLKDMADDCSLSSNAIHKRIAHLKASGVIAGSVTLFNPKLSGNMLAVSMEITVDYSAKDRIVRFVREYPGVVICMEGFGRCDILAFIAVVGINELDLAKETINKQPGVKKVVTAVQIEEVQFQFDNLDLTGDSAGG